MAKWGKCDYRQLKELQKRLDTLTKMDLDGFCREVSKELAARLLAKVIERTPVGQYDKPVKFTTADGKVVSFTPHTGKKGGALRRGWTGGKSSGAANYAKSLGIKKQGNTYTIEIINPVSYSSYVEYGHRTRNGGWVEGKHMLQISAAEIEGIAPALIEKRLYTLLRGVFENDK